MNVSYKKDLHHNYLVIPKIENSDDEYYCVSMLQANSIVGIIKPEPRTIDNKVLYYYDITSKQSIDTIFVKSTINYEQLKKLFIGLSELVEQAYEYLLNENDLLLDPEHIYIELNKDRVNVGYLPGYKKDLGGQMVSLIEYLMNRVDYNDKEAVFYIYNLYAVCRNEGFTFNDLLLALSEKKSGPSMMIRKEKEIGTSIKKDCDQGDVFYPNNDDIPKDEYRPSKQIPVMMEKVLEESEIYYYPLKNYIYTGACSLGAIMVFLICLKTKILYNTMGNRIDYGKLVALLLILTIIIGYLLKIIWDKNNRLTKMISKEKYIDPREEYYPRPQKKTKSEPIRREYEHPFPKEGLESTDKSDIEIESTVLLNADISTYKCCLEPEDKDCYELIPITEFPFVIGKVKSNVDYFLDKEVVSRYHVKISKEEEDYYITDLNSTNGTTLNNKPLSCYQRHKLYKDDKVSIAGIKYKFKS